MKVILRQNVESLGEIGEIVNVKAGYARNYLIPRSLAYVANDSAIRALETEKKPSRWRRPSRMPNWLLLSLPNCR
jgi:large subunit ribosomal protein L9